MPKTIHNLLYFLWNQGTKYSDLIQDGSLIQV